MTALESSRSPNLGRTPSQVRASVGSPPAFSFMKRVVQACMRLGPEEIAASSREGRVRFRSDISGKPELVSWDSEPSGSEVSLRASTVRRRAGILGKGFPELALGEEIDHIVLDDDGTESYHAERPFVRATKISVSSILLAAKRSFNEADTVGEVTELYSGDRMFVRFQGDSELYSITVRDSSVSVADRSAKNAGKMLSAALCEVAYRVRGEDSKPIERTLVGIMRLPIAVGSKMTFTDKGKIVAELSAQPMTKIQIRRSPKSAGNAS